jgi:hypothetical protein
MFSVRYSGSWIPYCFSGQTNLHFTGPSSCTLLVNECSLVTPSFLTQSQSQSYITTDGQSASLSWNKAPIWGLRPDFYYCQTVAGFVCMGRSLWREDGSVVYFFCWSPSPAQSFSGPSSVGLATIFYCLSFETSHSVASYDSQGHGGDIGPRLHAAFLPFLLVCKLLVTLLR